MIKGEWILHLLFLKFYRGDNVYNITNLCHIISFPSFKGSKIAPLFVANSYLSKESLQTNEVNFF